METEPTAIDEQEATTEPVYEGWAILELMGHRKLAGQVREVCFAGAGLLRIDVPKEDDSETAVTQFYGGAAIFSMTPCSEAAARIVLRERYGLPEPVLLALPAPGTDSSDIEDGDFDEELPL